MGKIADVMVIGGGVIGCASAYFLSKAGLNVALIEKGGIGSGTSSHCEGNVLVHDKMPGYDSRMARLSQQLFPEVMADLNGDIGWRQPGSLLVAESDEELEVAADFALRMGKAGIPVDVLDAAALRKLEPQLAPDLAGGLFFPTDASLNPLLLCSALSDAIRRAGAAVLSHTEVLGIDRDKRGAVCGILTKEGRMAAGCVVNAAGVWAPAIGRMVGLDIPIKPRQGQILVSERTMLPAARSIVEFGYLMAKFGNRTYRRRIPPEMERYNIAFVYEPTEAGNFLIGSSRRFTGMDIRCHPAVLRCLAARALRFLPGIRRTSIIRSYAGLRPYTPDHFPIVSETRVPGFYVAAGHEGDGIGLSMITGKWIMQRICGLPSEMDMEPLRLDRFDRKQIQQEDAEPSFGKTIQEEAT